MPETITKSQDTIIRGTTQQQTSRIARSLLYEGPTEKLVAPNLDETGRTWNPPITRPQKGLRISNWELQNRAAAAITVGIGFRWANSLWYAGDFDANGSPAFSRIANYQSRTEVVWATDFAEANNDALMIFSRRPWNWVSLNNTTASTGNVTTTLDYTGIDGNSWTDVPAGAAFLDNLTLTAADYANGEDVFVWSPPHDWQPTIVGHGLGSGIPEGMYGFRLLFDGVAGTNDPGWTGIEIGSMQFSGEELADNGLWSPNRSHLLDFDGDSVVAFFETAAAGNTAKFDVEIVA